jgi:multicomponent K+:H+ antiporter subunit D
MMVFAVKAALFPVQFWLPATYANAPAPVAALFAIMTKVGAYAILRVHTTAFGPGIPGTEDLAATWLFPAAIVTIAVGAFGVLGATPDAADRVLGGGVDGHAAGGGRGVFDHGDDRGALLHGAFHLRRGLPVPDRRPRVSRRSADTLRAEPATVQNGLFAALFFAAAIAMAGMPPLSGFLGKLLVLDALARAGRDRLGMVRDPDRLAPDHRRFRAGGQRAVLEIHRDPPARTRSGRGRHRRTPPPATAAQVAPTMLTLAMLALLAVFAGPVSAYLDDTSAQLFDREGYVDAVLGPAEEDEPC